MYTKRRFLFTLWSISHKDQNRSVRSRAPGISEVPLPSVLLSGFRIFLPEWIWLLRFRYASSDHRQCMPECPEDPAVPGLSFARIPRKETRCLHLYEKSNGPYLSLPFAVVSSLTYVRSRLPRPDMPLSVLPVSFCPLQKSIIPIFSYYIMLCRAHPTKFYIFLYPSSCFYNGSSKKLSFIYFTNTQIFYKKIEKREFYWTE